MVEYTGFTDCRIERDGTIHFPASSVYDPHGEMVVCRWSVAGYVPEPESDNEWLSDYLDEDGALE